MSLCTHGYIDAYTYLCDPRLTDSTSHEIAQELSKNYERLFGVQ